VNVCNLPILNNLAKMRLTTEVNNVDRSSELENTIDRTIDDQLEVSVYETLNFDDETPTEPYGTCYICYETCSEQRPMWTTGHCDHEICLICFITLLRKQNKLGPWASCPACRRSLDLRLRWSLPPPNKFTCSYDFLTSHYSRGTSRRIFGRY
jgi:hypothetical protein